MFLLSDLTRLTLPLDQWFDAYLRFFREASTCEQRDFNSIRSFVR